MRIVVFLISLVLMATIPACSYKPPAAPESHPESGGFPPPGGPKAKVPDSPPLADRDGDGAVSHNEGREEAKADFRDTVKTGTGWLMGLIGLASVALFIASFFIPTIPKGGAIVGVVSLAALWLARYMLLAYGVLAADILAWSLLGMAAISLIGGAWTLALWWKRRVLAQQGILLAQEPGKEREATALLAAANSKANEARKHLPEVIREVRESAGTTRLKLVKQLSEVGVTL